MEIDIVENGKQAVKKELTNIPQNIPNLNILPSINEKIKSSATEYIQNTNLNVFPENLINLPTTNPTTTFLNNVEDNQNIFSQENVIDEQAYPVSNIQPETDIGENYPVENIETNQETYVENNDINQYIEDPAPIQTPQDELNQIFSKAKNKIENIKDTAQTLINNPIAYNIAKNQVQNLYQNTTNKITSQISEKITNQIGSSYGITNPITNALVSHQINSYIGQINDNINNNIQNQYNNLEVTATKYLSPEELSNALNNNIKKTVGNKINDVKEGIKQKLSYFPTPFEHIENIIQTKYLNKYNLGINNIKTEENKALNTPNYDTPNANETILNGRPVKIIEIEGEENIHICPDPISNFCKILFA